MIAARWIRMELEAPLAIEGICAGLAAAQRVQSAPIVVWGHASAQRCLGLVAPLRHAPGLPRRWISWALAPVIAAYRGAGVAAYLEAGEIRVAGRAVAAASASSVGLCAVVTARLLQPFPGERYRGLVEAQYGWRFDTSWANAGERTAIGEARAASCAW